MATTETMERFYLVREPDRDDVLAWSIFDSRTQRVGGITTWRESGCFTAHDERQGFAGDFDSIDACAVAITGQRRLTLVWT